MIWLLINSYSILLGGITCLLLLTTYIQRSWLYFVSLVIRWLQNRRHLKYLFHLFIKEYYLVVLSNNYSVVIDLNETAKHIQELSLLSCTFKVFSISLVKSAGEEIYEQHCYWLIELDTYESSLANMRVVPNATVRQSHNICRHLNVLIVAQHRNWGKDRRFCWRTIQFIKTKVAEPYQLCCGNDWI